MRRPAAAACVAILLALAGCLERTITVTSEPPGAVVWLNNTEIGRTPVTTGFTFYGGYDVRLRKEGYEPIAAARTAHSPIYEYPPLDLAAEAIPLDLETNIVWHFDLTPADAVATPESEAALIERARVLRQRVEP